MPYVRIVVLEPVNNLVFNYVAEVASGKVLHSVAIYREFVAVQPHIEWYSVMYSGFRLLRHSDKTKINLKRLIKLAGPKQTWYAPPESWLYVSKIVIQQGETYLNNIAERVIAVAWADTESELIAMPLAILHTFYCEVI